MEPNIHIYVATPTYMKQQCSCCQSFHSLIHLAPFLKTASLILTLASLVQAAKSPPRQVSLGDARDSPNSKSFREQDKANKMVRSGLASLLRAGKTVEKEKSAQVTLAIRAF